MSRPLAGIVFDFDGVVLESAGIKTWAMGELFRRSPERRRIMAYHKAHMGTSRYEKFRAIYKGILGRRLVPAEMRRLDREFSGLVRRRILGCPEVRGMRRFRARYGDKMPLYVVSATPQRELRAIAAARGLAGFRALYGAPRRKADWLNRILLGTRTPARRWLFVGDTPADLAAARAAGFPFVARVARGKGVFPQNVPRVKDIAGLERRLRERLPHP